MADTPTLELRIRDNAEDAVGGLLHLANALAALKAHLGNLSRLSKVSTDIENFATKCNKAFNTDLVSNINNVSHALDEMTKARDISLPDMKAFKQMQDQTWVVGGATSGMVSGIEQMNVAAGDYAETTKYLSDNLGEMNQNVRNSASGFAESTNEMASLSANAKATASDASVAATEVGDVAKKADDSAQAAKEASKQIKEHAWSMKELSKAAQKAISPLDKVAHAFKRILFYRVIRSVLKEIAKGFSEGIKNVREYSKAINGTFNTAMISAEDTLFKLKNSLGAALAPAIEAVIPAIQTLVNWFITLINYVNQFIALISGKTSWTRAVDASAASFEKTKKAAKGAAKEVKNLLAGFDELNIIQSESGGNGGGGAGAFSPDYTKAFEEVYEFDKKIRDIVNWLKENAETIKTIVGEIGAAILAWRLSQAFSGILGKLFGLAAMGLVIKIVWDMVSYFDNKYLETGDTGWLVANVLTTAVGALATKGIIDKVIGTGWGTVAAGVTLAFSAAADIVANINHTDVSALSEQSVIMSILAAMKMGVAGYMIAKFFGMTIPQSLMVGGGAALITFGAAVGIKAVRNAVETDEFGDEYVKAAAISSVAMGLGTGLTLAAAGAGTVGTIAGTAGAALGVYGALIGIKAVKGKADAGWTKESIRDTAIASLGLGAGSAAIALLMGASAGVVGIVGGLGALATVGAIVGVSAILVANKKDIKFGDTKFTEEQIQEYVNENLIPTVDVDATINLVNTTIGNISSAKRDIETQLITYMGEINVVKLGIQTKSTYDNLIKQLYGQDGNGGIIGSVKDYAAQQTTLLKTGIAMVPIISKTGTDLSQEFLTAGISGWTGVQEFMEKEGNTLGELLRKGINKGLDPMEEELVQKLLNKFNSVTKAVTSAQVNSQSAAKLTVALTELDETTFHGVIDKFIEYRNELKEAYTSIYSQELQSFAELAAFYEATGNEELAKQFRDKYDLLSDSLASSIDEAVKKATGEGSNKIARAMQRIFGEGFAKKFSNFDWGTVSAVWSEMYDSYAEKAGDSAISRAEYIQNMFNETMLDNIADFTGLTKEELSTLGIEVGSFLSKDVLSNMGLKMWKTQAELYGFEAADVIAKAFGITIPEEMRKATEESIAAAEQDAQAIKDELAGLTVVGPAEQVSDALDSAAKGTWNFVSQGTINVMKFILGAIDTITKEVDVQREEVNDIFEEAIENTNKKYKLDELQKEIAEQQKVVDNYNGAITKLWEAVMHPENYTDKQNATNQRLFNDNSPTSIFAMYESAVGKLEELKQAYESLRDNFESDIEVPEPNVKPLTDNFSWAEKVIIKGIQNVLKWLQYLGSYKVNVEFDIGGGGKVNAPFTTNMLKAGGGFVGTGEMFVAREAGPELVGRIGSRTAVANNDQIVAGVANGVAAGQGEQNALLRQQNDLLRQMLAKSGRVEAVPSAAWGKFVKRSAEMYASNTGM